MTLKTLLARSRKVLTAAGIDSPALESELLLRHVLGIGRVGLYTGFCTDATHDQEKTFWQSVQRRLAGEPSAYITGHREFYGLDFCVDHRVLIPRPESELLVEEALNIARRYDKPAIADIGTGSGCIAVSLALNLPRATVYATDISASALEVARFNSHKYGIADAVHLLQGDLLEPLTGPVDLIIANLPYVRREELCAAGHLRFEPALALDGGPDGLDLVRRFCQQLGGKLRSGGSALLEIGDGQTGAVLALLQGIFPSAIIRLTKDLSGFDRMISLFLPARATCEPSVTIARTSSIS